MPRPAPSESISRYAIPIAFAIFVSASVIWATYARFGSVGDKLPIGCDEFGYLNMAKAISQGELLGDHASRPFIDGLLADLRVEEPEVDAYRWMIAPHAYHVGPNDDKIINQYPPGVGFMLAPFPLQWRRPLFSAVCAAIGCFAILLAVRIDSGSFRRSAGIALIPFLAVLLSGFKPIVIELVRVNSLAPTFGLLIAAGWLLPRKPLWAIGLLSMTTVFRIPNVILALPFGFACLFLCVPTGGGFKAISKKSLLSVASFVASGFGLYLIYVCLLLGNPFLVTYSPIDQEFARSSAIADNLSFYLVEKNSWLWPNLAALAGLLLASILRRQWRWLFFGTAIVLLNYAFFLFHHVQIDYYPYASAFVVAGLAISLAGVHRLTGIYRVVLVGLSLVVATVFAFHSSSRNSGFNERFFEQIANYETVFGSFDVVWAETRSGTVEYATHKAGFRYNWGPERTRATVMNWLGKHGYTQVIWVDDIGMPEREKIEKTLSNHSIGYSTRSIPDFGEILVLDFGET